jgi:hypothetical protein
MSSLQSLLYQLVTLPVPIESFLLMPPASHGFIIESMLPESSICLMLLFKGSLSTCVDHFSEILTLHVGDTLNLSHNHMIL